MQVHAIEAYHSSHDEATTLRYIDMARHHGVGISGGSDYNGEGTRRSEFFGVTQLPSAEFSALTERHGSARVSAAQQRGLR